MDNNKQLSKDAEAQVGIGTMIVFIATILVAAVAAGVLIDTSQKLQDKSTQTGTEAINNVGTSLEVLTIYGERDQTNEDGTTTGASSEALDMLRIQVRLAAGAADMDLSKMRIQFSDGTSGGFLVYTHGDATTTAQRFSATWLSGTSADNILESGEIVELTLGNTDTDNDGTDLSLQVGTGTSLDLNFLPEVGEGASIGFTTPNTYGSGKIFELF